MGFAESIHVTGFDKNADNTPLRLEVSADRDYVVVYDENNDYLFGVEAKEMHDLINRVQVIWPEFPNTDI